MLKIVSCLLDFILKLFLFSGKSMEPVIGKLNSDELVLMKDEVSVFVNSDGDPTYKQSFTWSDNPITLSMYNDQTYK